MKKLAFISLILLTLLIAVQPVLYFHYCQGELSSIALQTTQDSSCCNQLPAEEGVHKAACCTDNTVVLSVDNYQASKYHFNLVNVFVTIQNYLLLPSNLDAGLKEDIHIHLRFLYKRVLDRLAFICIYRI